MDLTKYTYTFATSILDEVCRSMDAGSEKQSRTVIDKYEDFASIRRACFLEHETACFTTTKPKTVKTTSVSEKEKQPVKTTGGKLASFLNSMLRNGNSKKMKKNSSSSSTGGYGDARVERKPKVAKCFPANCYGWEMVRSCCNEIPQPGTLGYLDAAGASSNVLQLKRLRETLSAALIFQDLSFFDKEAVGDLTSRFQKKAAKFTQEYSASANEAAQETFSLIRTVRVYGTEEEELGRYKQWLDKLVYIGIRESVAYGSWYLSFNTLYRSTQVFAVLLGGMSILTGHVSAEQLMKYVLYCEWLIYAAWRLEDKLSSLLQAIGASEKVPVLEHVNISVQTNEMVAIVGLSGSGKSTLVNLLLRLYEPTSAEVKRSPPSFVHLFMGCYYLTIWNRSESCTLGGCGTKLDLLDRNPIFFTWM
ncbi:unnamed protein product [Camellia sinensis]